MDALSSVHVPPNELSKLYEEYRKAGRDREPEATNNNGHNTHASRFMEAFSHSYAVTSERGGRVDCQEVRARSRAFSAGRVIMESAAKCPRSPRKVPGAATLRTAVLPPRGLAQEGAREAADEG